MRGLGGLGFDAMRCRRTCTFERLGVRAALGLSYAHPTRKDSTVLPTETAIKEAVRPIRPRTPGVRVGAEVRVGHDSTNDEAVWVYVVVPDERIEDFYSEWEGIRAQIRTKVRDALQNPEILVYVRMHAASEVDDES